MESELVDSLVWTEVTSAGGRAVEREDHEVLYLIVGTLDEGTDVTMLGASRRRDVGIPPWHQHPQHFSFLRCFLGGHVTEETEYETAEVVPDGLWSTWLPGVDVTADVEITGVGTVTLTIQDGRVVAHGSAMTAEQWVRRVTDPFCALLMLISGHDVTIPETVLRRPDESEVREVIARGDAPDTRRLDCLITPSELTPEVLVGWFDFVHQTVPVPMVLGQTICQRDRTVEADVLVLAACAEAIHREVFDEPAMSRERAKELRRATLEGLDGDDRRVIEDRLNDLTAMTFHTRLVSLIGRIGGLAEAVCGSVGDGRKKWLKRVKGARNSFAHMARSAPEDLSVYSGEMVVLYESLRWLITAVVLRHVGIPPERVTEVIESASGFQLFRERAVGRLPSVYGPASS